MGSLADQDSAGGNRRFTHRWKWFLAIYAASVVVFAVTTAALRWLLQFGFR